MEANLSYYLLYKFESVFSLPHHHTESKMLSRYFIIEGIDFAINLSFTLLKEDNSECMIRIDFVMSHQFMPFELIIFPLFVGIYIN